MRRFCVLGVLLTVAVTAILCPGCSKKPFAAVAPPEDVLVAEVVQRDVPVYGEWTGTSDGFVNAQVRAQVSGYLMRQCYREGSKVKKGDLLFEIDPRPFRALLHQAQALLDQAQAQLGKTELDVKRLTPLAKEQAVSQQELDDAVQANLANMQAILANKAAVETAQLNLEFTRITSPVDGIAGIATAQVGDLAGPATGDLTTVSTVDPIKIYFQVSEREYLESPEFFANGSRPAGGPGPQDLELILTNGSVYPQRGTLYVVSRAVDARTGTLQVGALFPNPGDVLRPGQFARVRAVLRTRKGALLAPQRAVTELQGSYEVVVVGSDNKASLRPVTVGERMGPMWVIEKGLSPGESVIVEGVQKVREGTTVNPKPFAPPAPAASKP